MDKTNEQLKNSLLNKYINSKIKFNRHFISIYCMLDVTPLVAHGKEFPCQCRFNSWILKIPWRRKWQPSPVFLPGKFHGQRSLVGYSSWNCKELDTTKHSTTLLRMILRFNCKLHNRPPVEVTVLIHLSSH